MRGNHTGRGAGHCEEAVRRPAGCCKEPAGQRGPDARMSGGVMCIATPGGRGRAACSQAPCAGFVSTQRRAGLTRSPRSSARHAAASASSSTAARNPAPALLIPALPAARNRASAPWPQGVANRRSPRLNWAVLVLPRPSPCDKLRHVGSQLRFPAAPPCPPYCILPALSETQFHADYTGGCSYTQCKAPFQGQSSRAPLVCSLQKQDVMPTACGALKRVTERRG